MLWTAFESRREAAFSRVLVRFRARVAAEYSCFQYIHHKCESSSENRWLQLSWTILVLRHDICMILYVMMRYNKTLDTLQSSQKPQKTQLLTVTRTLSKAQLLTSSNFNFRVVWIWGDMRVRYHPHKWQNFPLLKSHIPTTHILVLMIYRRHRILIFGISIRETILQVVDFVRKFNIDFCIFDFSKFL